MNRKLDTSEKESSVDLLIAGEDPDLPKTRDIGKSNTGDVTIQSLCNITAVQVSEVVTTYHEWYSRGNLRESEPRVEYDCCIRGLCTCNLSLDLDWFAIWADDAVDIK